MINYGSDTLSAEDIGSVSAWVAATWTPPAVDSPASEGLSSLVLSSTPIRWRDGRAYPYVPAFARGGETSADSCARESNRGTEIVVLRVILAVLLAALLGVAVRVARMRRHESLGPRATLVPADIMVLRVISESWLGLTMEALVLRPPAHLAVWKSTRASQGGSSAGEGSARPG